MNQPFTHKPQFPPQSQTLYNRSSGHVPSIPLSSSEISSPNPSPPAETLQLRSRAGPPVTPKARLSLNRTVLSPVPMPSALSLGQPSAPLSPLSRSVLSPAQPSAPLSPRPPSLTMRWSPAAPPEAGPGCAPPGRRRPAAAAAVEAPPAPDAPSSVPT